MLLRPGTSDGDDGHTDSVGTSRYSLTDLSKVEKTYIGTKVEIVIQSGGCPREPDDHSTAAVGRRHGWAGSEWATRDPATVYRIEKGTGFGTSADDGLQIVEEVLGHYGRRQVLAGQAEAAGAVLLDRPTLAGSDAAVFGEGNPAATRGQGEPILVWHGLILGNPVVLGKSNHPESLSPQQTGDLQASEAAIQEEVRQPGRM